MDLSFIQKQDAYRALSSKQRASVDMFVLKAATGALNPSQQCDIMESAGFVILLDDKISREDRAWFARCLQRVIRMNGMLLVLDKMSISFSEHPPKDTNEAAALLLAYCDGTSEHLGTHTAKMRAMVDDLFAKYPHLMETKP